jgi:hypothetical protein
MKNANYRKHNDRTLNSSKYHKRDGTNIRAKLKEETRREVRDYAAHAAVEAGATVDLRRGGVGTVIENDPKNSRARISRRGPTNQVYTDFYHYDNFTPSANEVLGGAKHLALFAGSQP